MESKRRLAEKDRKAKAYLRKEKEEALLLKSKEISPFETQKDHAFRLMDQAKYQFNLNNFDIAIKLYRESENIFSEIKWAAGITMIRDSIDLIADSGVTAIIQPGGSIRDNEVIQACDEHGIGMIFTGLRCFKH